MARALAADADVAGAASDQLAWEARAGRIAAGAAVLALLLFVAGSAYGLTAEDRRQPRTLGDLGLVGRDPIEFVLPAVLAGIAFLLFGVVLAYLYRVAKFRRRELPVAALALLVFGAIAAAVTLIAQRIDIVNAAQSLTATGSDAGAPVRDELRGRVPLQIILGLNLGGYLALGLATVLISVSAMRAGILSRFLGILGVVAALSLLLPLLPLQVLFMFWLGALAVLFLDRWPGGRGPAWATGESVRWPGMAERNAELDRRGAERDAAEDDRSSATRASAELEGDAERASNGAQSESPGTGGEPAHHRSKRKRGRRR